MRKEYDFSKAKKAKDVPHLAKLQAEAKGKTRITIILDNFVIDAFRQLAEQEGMGSLSPERLAPLLSLETRPLDEKMLRRVVREELGAYKP